MINSLVRSRPNANATLQQQLAYARRYAAGFDLDPADIGDLLAAGKQHDTFRYQDRWVIKVPQPSLYMQVYGVLRYQDILRDVQLLQEYLAPYTPETHVLRAKQGDDYVIVQEYLQGATYITAPHMPALRDDFQRILAANRAMVGAHKLSIDFFGNKGLRQSIRAVLTGRRDQALINNLLRVATPDGPATAPPIKIVDVNLSGLAFPGAHAHHWFRWGIDRGLYHVSAWLLRALFDLRV
jgi:hypothetical protein